MSLRSALFLAKRLQIKSLISSTYHLNGPLVRHDNFIRSNFLSQCRLCSTSKGEVMKPKLAAIFVLNIFFLKRIDKPAYQPIVEQAPQILSKLFPQTADIQKSAEEIQREEQKKEEEEKKEQESSWKRMKLG